MHGCDQMRSHKQKSQVVSTSVWPSWCQLEIHLEACISYWSIHLEACRLVGARELPYTVYTERTSRAYMDMYRTHDSRGSERHR